MKGLEAFKNKSNYLGGKSVQVLLTLDEHENIQKELKALEIIRKLDNMKIYLSTFLSKNSGLMVYFIHINNAYWDISKEQYDLLKEVLKNE